MSEKLTSIDTLISARGMLRMAEDAFKLERLHRAPTFGTPCSTSGTLGARSTKRLRTCEARGGLTDGA